MDEGKRYPFAPDTALQRQRAYGHLLRTGHRLEGYWTPDGNGISEFTYTCC